MFRFSAVKFETDRLLVRCPRPGDGIHVYEGVTESLSELRAWPRSLPWSQHEPSLEISEEFCQRGQKNFSSRTDFPFLIFLKDTTIFIGCTGLHRPDWALSKIEIGYWGRTAYLGRGLMKEAVDGATQFAFNQLGIRRVECITDISNLRSRRIAERCGYTLECIFEREAASKDEICCYSIAR